MLDFDIMSGPSVDPDNLSGPAGESDMLSGPPVATENLSLVVGTAPVVPAIVATIQAAPANLVDGGIVNTLPNYATLIDVNNYTPTALSAGVYINGVLASGTDTWSTGDVVEFIAVAPAGFSDYMVTIDGSVEAQSPVIPTIAASTEEMVDGQLINTIANYATLIDLTNYTPNAVSAAFYIDGVLAAGTDAVATGEQVELRVEGPAGFLDYIVEIDPAVEAGTTAPANTTPASITPTSANLGAVLTATPGVWTGTPAPTLTYQWQRDGVDIAGETGLTYTVVVADDAAAITVIETADNGVGAPVPVPSSNSVTPDAATPNLSALVLTAGDTEITANFDSDDASGNVFFALTTSATAPSNADIEAGTGAVSSGSQPVTATGAQTSVNITGLTNGTQYYFYAFQRDAAGNESVVITDTATPFAVATVAILTIDQPVDEGDVPTTFLTDIDVTCEAVLYLATDTAPTASDFNQGGGIAATYIDLGTISLTTVGTNINLAVPDGIEDTYILALLPAGGGDADIALSPSVFIDTLPSGSVDTTPTKIGEAVTGNTAQGGDETLPINLSGHDPTKDVLIVFGAFGDNQIDSATFNGVASTALLSQAASAVDGVFSGYARFAAATLPASADLFVTYVGSGRDLGAVAYDIDPGATVSVLTTQPETTRTGSDVSGNVVSGDSVIATQIVKDGVAATLAGVTEDYQADIRANEWFIVGSAANVAAETPRAITATGTNVRTAALSVRISV